MSNMGILLGLGFNALARILETVLLHDRKDDECYERGEGLNGMLELCPQEGRLRQEDILGRIHDMRPESPINRQHSLGVLENTFQFSCWGWVLTLSRAVSSQRVTFGNAGVFEMTGLQRSTSTGQLGLDHPGLLYFSLLTL